jgi:16S rRNA (guanine1207-N2)-methyltransferase
MNLLSLLPVGIDIFVVGENRSGVRSAEQMLAEYAPLNKVDSASLWAVSRSSGKTANV